MKRLKIRVPSEDGGGGGGVLSRMCGGGGTPESCLLIRQTTDDLYVLILAVVTNFSVVCINTRGAEKKMANNRNVLLYSVA